MEKFPISDIADKYGVSSKTLSYLARTGRFQDAEQDQISKEWFLSLSDLQIIEDFLKFVQESYNFQDVAKVLELSDYRVGKLVREGILGESIKWGNSKYVRKSIVHQYNVFQTNKENNMNCNLVPLVAKKFGISDGRIRSWIRSGSLPEAQKILYERDGREAQYYWLLSENDIQKIQYVLEFIKKSYTTSEVLELLGISKKKLDAMVKNNEFKEVLKWENKLYINKTEVNTYYTYQNQILENYLTTDEIGSILGLSEFSIRKYISKFKTAVLFCSHWYIEKSEVNQIKTILDSHYSTLEASKILGISSASICAQCKRGTLPSATRHPLDNDNWLIPKETIDSYEKVYNPMPEANDLHPFDAFLVRFNATVDKNDYPQTYELVLKYMRDIFRLSKTSKPHRLSRDLARRFSQIFNQLNKELFEYNHNELLDIIANERMSRNARRLCATFISFLRLREKKIHPSWHETYITKDAEYDKKTDNDKIYLPEIWAKYFFHLTDIDKHIIKATQNQRYSLIWLNSLLHMVLAWRSTDFLKMPNIELEEVKSIDFDWFYHNTFTLALGERVISYVRSLAVNIYADKTDARAHFVVPMDCIVPISVAFVIAEIHRRNLKHTTLFEKLLSSSPRKQDYIKLFFDAPELQKWSSIVANRTLETYGLEHAIKSGEGFAHIAYDMASFMRSHKRDGKSEIAPTTEKYIYSTNQDGSPQDVAFHLFRRGFWGARSREIALIVNIKSKELTMSEETKMIEELNEQFSPIELDNLASFMSLQLNNHLPEMEESNKLKQLNNIEKPKSKINSVVAELLQKSASDIREIVKKLIRKEMPAKIPNAQCLKFRQCPFITSNTCFGCDYLIPEYYLLYSINNELLNLIDTLSNTKDHEINKRIKYTNYIKRMLNLLQEAKREYDKYDPNYIYNFFNLEQLHNELLKVQDTKFLT